MLNEGYSRNFLLLRFSFFEYSDNKNFYSASLNLNAKQENGHMFVLDDKKSACDE